MRELEINPNWTFREFVLNIQTLRSNYEEVLASFYYFDIEEVVKFKRNTRNTFYSFPFEEWKKDRLWEYMNGFASMSDLISICRR